VAGDFYSFLTPDSNNDIYSIFGSTTASGNATPPSPTSAAISGPLVSAAGRYAQDQAHLSVQAIASHPRFEAAIAEMAGYFSSPLQFDNAEKMVRFNVEVYKHKFCFPMDHMDPSTEIVRNYENHLERSEHLHVHLLNLAFAKSNSVTHNPEKKYLSKILLIVIKTEFSNLTHGQKRKQLLGLQSRLDRMLPRNGNLAAAVVEILDRCCGEFDRLKHISGITPWFTEELLEYCKTFI